MKYRVHKPGTDEEERFEEGAPTRKRRRRERDEDITQVTRILDGLGEATKAAGETAERVAEKAEEAEEEFRKPSSQPVLRSLTKPPPKREDK